MNRNAGNRSPAPSTHYHVDMKHALDVRDSAMFLFSALRSVHGLAPEFREWLSAAAMLYEVGDYVNRNGHHRHTYYIISNSEILGYTPQQRRIIAAIARYLGKSRPLSEEAPMKAHRSRGPRGSAESDSAAAAGAGPEPGPQPRRAEGARQPARRGDTPDAGAPPAHGSRPGTVGNREGLLPISAKCSDANFPLPQCRECARLSASSTTSACRSCGACRLGPQLLFSIPPKPRSRTR